MTWATLQPELHARQAQDEEGASVQQEVDRPLEVDPGHVRTRQHYEEMLEEQRAGQ